MRAAGAPSVGRIVRGATRSLAAVRGVETVLWTAAGMAATAAAIVVSGGTLNPEACLVAGIGGLALGASWWVQHRPRARGVASELDAAVGFDGALTTAWECEQREAAGPVVACLRARVLRRLAPRTVRRALMPSSALSIAAPFLAFALLASVLQRAQRGAAPDLAALIHGLGEVLEEAGGAAPAPSAAQDAAPGDLQAARALVGLRGRTRSLETRVDALADEPQALRDELAELDQELADLRREVTDDELAAELDRARSWIDAARGGPGAAGPGEAGRAAASPQSERQGQGPAVAGPHAGPGTGSAGGPLDGPTRPAGAAPVVGRGPWRAEAGAPLGRSWPGRYDRLVERWVGRASETGED